jgi:hypothetical protein
MVKILTKGEYVDFEAPVWMDEDNFNKIFLFFKEHFGKVEVIDVKEKDRFENINKKSKESKRWEAEELVLLLNPKISINELVIKLKRSEMSIKMQRAQFMPSFISWARKNNISIEEIPNKENVERYLEESAK